MASAPTRASSAPPTPESDAQPDAKVLDPVKRKADSVPPSVSPTSKKMGDTAVQETPALKRKLDDLDATPSPDIEAIKQGTPAKKPKTTGPTVKRAKTTTPRAKKTATASSAVAKRSRKTPSPQQNMAPDSTTAPAPVNTAVANKIKQVKAFLGRGHDSVLEHDPKNPNHVMVPSSLLAGAVTVMRTDYQIGSPEDAEHADVDDAIIHINKRSTGTDAVEVDWFTVDVSVTTEFETKIKEKIPDSGLEDVCLLEIQMEMIQRDLLERYTLPEPELSEYRKRMRETLRRPAALQDEDFQPRTE